MHVLDGATKRTDTESKAGNACFTAGMKSTSGRLRLLSRLLTPRVSFRNERIAALDKNAVYKTPPAEWQLRICRAMLARPLKDFLVIQTRRHWASLALRCCSGASHLLSWQLWYAAVAAWCIEGVKETTMIS